MYPDFLLFLSWRSKSTANPLKSLLAVMVMDDKDKDNCLFSLLNNSNDGSFVVTEGNVSIANLLLSRLSKMFLTYAVSFAHAGHLVRS